MRIQESLALARLLELRECCQIDCAQLGNCRSQTIDLGLIRSRTRFPLDRVGELLNIGARFSQLLRIVFLVDARLLLLHAQLGNLVSQRLQTALDGTLTFFQPLQFSGR